MPFLSTNTRFFCTMRRGPPVKQDLRMILKLAYCKIPSTDFESEASKARGNILDSIRTLFSEGIEGDSCMTDSVERNV